MRLGRNLARDQNDRPRTRLRPGGRLSSGPGSSRSTSQRPITASQIGPPSPANPTTRRPRPGPRNADDHESRGCRHARPQRSRGRFGRHRAARKGITTPERVEEERSSAGRPWWRGRSVQRPRPGRVGGHWERSRRRACSGPGILRNRGPHPLHQRRAAAATSVQAESPPRDPAGPALPSASAGSPGVCPQGCAAGRMRM